MQQKLLGLLLMATLCLPVFAADKKDEVDYLAMAALMIRDGDYERAQNALSQVKLEHKKTDKKRYYTLQGLIFLRQQNYSNAVESFKQSIANGQTEAVIHVYLAQAHFGLKEYEAALQDISNGGEVAAEKPGMWLMRSTAHWELKQKQQSWEVLLQGEQRFPDNVIFKRQKLLRLVQLGLAQDAAQLGFKYLEQQSAQPEDYILVGKALAASGQRTEALRFLEVARLRFPKDERTSLALANVYVELEAYHSAAELLEESARVNSELYVDVAELYRRAKNIPRALVMNGRITDQQKKFKQRLALLLEMQQFATAAAIENDLFRVGLLDDEQIRFALAYANFKKGEFEKTESLLSDIRSPSLFRQSTQLREAMLTCEGARWKCY